MKVNFLIVGAQKCGTTALSKFLSEHPQICMANTKETHFFDRDKLFATDRPNYDEYHKYFKNLEKYKVVGEATPIYMYWRSAPPRIKKYNPKMKLIFILRNPIERAYSQYIMELKRRNESWSFSNAIRFEKIRCLIKFPKQHRVYSYIDRGYYSKQIKNMFKYFSKDQMLFLKTEELMNNHDASLKKVFNFLGVDKVDDINSSVVFSNDYESMDVSDKKYLMKKFFREINELERLLSWDCSSWKK